MKHTFLMIDENETALVHCATCDDALAAGDATVTPAGTFYCGGCRERIEEEEREAHQAEEAHGMTAEERAAIRSLIIYTEQIAGYLRHAFHLLHSTEDSAECNNLQLSLNGLRERFPVTTKGG